jgi:hypothetical protein
MALAKTVFANGSDLLPAFLNEIPAANCEPQHVQADVVLSSITQSPSNGWGTAPSGNIVVSKHVVDSRVVNVSGVFLFRCNVAVNYLTILLPSGFRPYSSTFEYNGFAKCAVVEENLSGIFTDIHTVYAKPRWSTNDGLIYIGNKEVCRQVPATTTFNADVFYHVGFSMSYKLNSSD